MHSRRVQDAIGGREVVQGLETVEYSKGTMLAQ